MEGYLKMAKDNTHAGSHHPKPLIIGDSQIPKCPSEKKLNPLNHL